MVYFERRVLETLISHLVVSVAIAFLFYFELLQPSYRLSVFMLCAAAIFDVVEITFFTSIYYKFTEENTKNFYKTNLLAVSVLVIPAILLALLDSVVSLEPIYTFLFFPFKLGMISLGMSKPFSAFLFGMILLLAAGLPPLLLRKAIFENEPMPPMMELDENEKKVSE